jgi:hypothetical protein
MQHPPFASILNIRLKESYYLGNRDHIMVRTGREPEDFEFPLTESCMIIT